MRVCAVASGFSMRMFGNREGHVDDAHARARTPPRASGPASKVDMIVGATRAVQPRDRLAVRVDAGFQMLAETVWK